MYNREREREVRVSDPVHFGRYKRHARPFRGSHFVCENMYLYSGGCGEHRCALTPPEAMGLANTRTGSGEREGGEKKEEEEASRIDED